MRVLLIQPPYDLFKDDERQAMPPLGLAYIAAVLERARHEVEIIDCVVEGFQQLAMLPDGRRRHGLTDAQVSRAVADFRPAVVGVSCLFSAQANAAHHVCRLVKQVDPGIRVVMGGAHPSAIPEQVLADANVDVVVLGEGELSMLRLVDSLEAGQFPPADPAGFARREAGGVGIHRAPHFLENLDSLPLPARHLLPMRWYFDYRAPHGGVVSQHPCTNMITSRGCPAKCSFCSIHTVWGRKFRWHSAERVLREIEVLMDEYGVREIQFEDDNLTLHKPRMTEICRMIIERRLDLTWTMPNGAAIYALDERLLGLMREAGCYHLTVAVESGSPQVLKHIIRKPLDLKKVPPLIRAARKLGMGVSAFFVVGFPGESRSDIERTFSFAMEMDADQVHFFTATPYPGTALYDECVEKGYLHTPVDFASLRVGRPIIDTPAWTAGELAELTRAAQNRAYRRAAMRRPSRFLAALARKFAREPVLTLRKAREALRASPAPAALQT